MQLNPRWEFISDTVMGGISTGSVTQEIFEGRNAAVLRGEVSLDNNGGFVQMDEDIRDGALRVGFYDVAWSELRLNQPPKA